MTTNFYRLTSLLTTLFFSVVSFSQQVSISISPSTNNQTFSTCNGFIIDSGGQGGPGYSNNETDVVTICPDTPGDKMTVIFNLFNLDMTDDDPSPGITNVDHMIVYDGASTSANSLGTYSGNELIGVTIMATEQNASGCLTFQFVSNSTGTGSFAGSASCTTPCNDPVAQGGILDGITSDSIHICIGETVNFQNQGSFAQSGFNLTAYNWEFMDGTSSDLENPSHTFSAPGLYNVQLFVTDDNNCESNNYLSLQVVVAPEPDFSTFPTDTVICLGETISFTAIPDDYEVSMNSMNNTVEISDGCITDNQLGVTQNLDLVLNAFAPGAIITDVAQIESICFGIEHSFMGDLVIQLTCPNGQHVMLHQQGGGGTQLGVPIQADGINCDDPSTIGTPYTYCFTPTATDTWIEWVAAQSEWALTLPEGDYEPIEPLSNLVGCPANGIWTLGVTDNWAADDGRIFSFTLNLDPMLYSEIVTINPQIGGDIDSSYWSPNGDYINSISADGDVITITPTEPGVYNYVYNVIDDFGCVHDTSLTVTVYGIPTVFAGNDTLINCWEQLQLNPQVEGINSLSSCEYTLVLSDDFGDGWNGNTVTVTIGGVSNTYTLQSGPTSTISFPVANNDNVTVTFNATGVLIAECSYTVYNANGVEVFHQDHNMVSDTTTTFIAYCSDYSYSWTSNNPNAQISNSTIHNPIIATDGLTTFVLSVFPTLNPNCVVSDTIVIDVDPLPATPLITASGSLTICEGDTITLTSSYATSYLWSTGAFTQSINVTTAGDYTVTVYSPQGLSATSSVTSVTVIPSPTLTMTGDTILCEGEASILTVSGADTYQWSDGTSNNNTTVYGILSFPVTVTGTVNGCSSVLNQWITVNPLPEIPVITGDASLLVSTAASSYQWYLNGILIDGATNQEYIVTTLGNYTVEITDENGCSSISEVFTIYWGLNSLNAQDPISVHPNPSTGKFHVTFDNPKINTVKVLNTAGSVIFSSTAFNSEIDLSSHSKGIYFLKIEADDKIYVRKLIVN